MPGWLFILISTFSYNTLANFAKSFVLQNKENTVLKRAIAQMSVNQSSSINI